MQKRWRDPGDRKTRDQIRSADLEARVAKEAAEGLILPRDVALERAEKARREEAEAEVERRRHSVKADRAVRRDGKVRKGAHTQSRYRSKANRRRGLKGITGA